MGMYRPPFAFIYAFVSRTAAFMYGAAANPSGVFTPSLEIKNPAMLSYLLNASMTFVKAVYEYAGHEGDVWLIIVSKVSTSKNRYIPASEKACIHPS